MTIFDIIENISNSNEVLSREELERIYNPYMVLDYFGKFEDTIFIANELNSFKTQLSNYDHYLYLFTIIRKKKRRYKYSKKDLVREGNIKIIMEYYECSREVAIRDMLPLLTDINIEEMNRYLTNYGGIETKKK